ncbi:class IV adenylate cyclase [Pseudodesulfovibrio senegalensis]|jgi:predicted adenylyl cyclase CyaB|uniref:Class IV adenylate cyclase n=1 Tax=Pseudodesulfovibrio senegalensis TaxID=1721087 RepID=A0A6N6N700_9BACT|nr:class IV adenylate cyclase [Pseudodesulfovibrio senegalensis]KAB1443229.1 class IV adenylate cyclase [Pseudodesulfovibrio senegalensis]
MVNVEIKARITNPERIRDILMAAGAEYHGLDKQCDTYFNCPQGRLKLREGNVENSLIFYRRPDTPEPKVSEYELERLVPGHGMVPLLSAAFGVKVVVEKEREIYFKDNVKFHIDRVRGLGRFVEIEAIGEHAGELDTLHGQCSEWLECLGISMEQLEPSSYSDMFMALDVP